MSLAQRKGVEECNSNVVCDNEVSAAKAVTENAIQRSGPYRTHLQEENTAKSGTVGTTVVPPVTQPMIRSRSRCFSSIWLDRFWRAFRFKIAVTFRMGAGARATGRRCNVHHEIDRNAVLRKSLSKGVIVVGQETECYKRK